MTVDGEISQNLAIPRIVWSSFLRLQPYWLSLCSFPSVYLSPILSLSSLLWPISRLLSLSALYLSVSVFLPPCLPFFILSSFSPSFFLPTAFFFADFNAYVPDPIPTSLSASLLHASASLFLATLPLIELFLPQSIPPFLPHFLSPSFCLCLPLPSFFPFLPLSVSPRFSALSFLFVFIPSCSLNQPLPIVSRQRAYPVATKLLSLFSQANSTCNEKTE